jgi:hypothetical protein
VLDILKKQISFFGIVPELVAKDAKTAWCVPEAPGDFMGQLAVEEKGPKRFVLPMQGLFELRKKACLGGLCYLIARSDSHTYILLYRKPNVKYIVVLLVGAPICSK